jgi:3-methyladenine DNA glycosylase AlkD
MQNSLPSLKKHLRSIGTPERAKVCAWFFKTAPGQYGHGDIFIGITVPDMRKIAKKYADLSIKDAESLLKSKEHEFRYTALLILVDKYNRAKKAGDTKIQKQIFTIYLKNTKWINNWDLVDTSAEYIVGDFLDSLPGKTGQTTKMRTLTKLAKSKSLWERRIAMISTFAYIKRGKHQETTKIAELLLGDKHDLIHKAVGWMLREMGKKTSLDAEIAFIHKHISKMPRTTLRYAIERFPETERQMYLSLGRFPLAKRKNMLL